MQTFADHDDRSALKTSDIKRRVSFKTNTRNSRGGFSDAKVRAFLDDEDMGGDLSLNNSDGNFQRRSNFRGRRKGSPIPRYNVGGGGKLIVSPGGWYQVLISHGAKYQKTEILGLIHTALQPDAFAPHYYKIDEQAKSAYFYVEDYDMADKIMKFDRKLSLSDGFKMLIKVRGSMPQVKIDESLKERIKIAMGKRYNPATKALDLTKFHADAELTDVFCSLARPPIMNAVIDIIAANIPDLEALNLNDNKINQMDAMKTLAQKLKCIKTLYMANNKVSYR
jgi:nuclear RNA export factor